MMPISRPREFLTPLVAIFVLTASCIASTYYLPFWFDELLTHYVVSDPSFSHMLGAESDLINTTPPLYFIVVWPLAQIFGASELPLRLFSSFAISAALVMTWHLLRRLYGTRPASVAVVVGFLGSTAVWYQNMEARMYGMFLAEIAVAVLLAVQVMSSHSIRWYWLAGNSAIHGAIVTTHYFGILYSGAILAATFVMLLKRRPILIRWVASVLIGWLAFVPCIPIFVHHLEFSKPHGWIPPPTITDFAKVVGGDIFFTFPAAVAIMGCLFVIRLLSGKRFQSTSSDGVEAERKSTGLVNAGAILCALRNLGGIADEVADVSVEVFPSRCFGVHISLCRSDTVHL